MTNPQTTFKVQVETDLLDSANKQIIDYAVLAQLKKDISEAVYPELLKMYLDQGNERVAKIEQAMADADFASLANEIHSFKSESATFGAIKLTELTAHINLLCNQNQQAEAFAAATAIQDNWRLVYSELQR